MLNNVFLLQIIDKFFIIFHVLIIFFNLFGFLFKKTRLANLICLLITGFSWVILGIWHGFGYCFLVDWHWSIRHKLGHRNDPNSFIKFLLDTITGLDINAELIDTMTGLLFSLALIISLILNFRDYVQRRSKA